MSVLKVPDTSRFLREGIFASADGPHRSLIATAGIRTGVHTVGTHVYYSLSPPDGVQSVKHLSARTPCRRSLVRSPAVGQAAV
ncbi:unnamed protein product [Albugo candida]|uniref:Uncharacterized protein n=1 Tax=Albugo candida TaxID=65357 RepID=A0A024FT66_9STRA|nr:unnamed protein product [Albugo candida]|eukprot:CCI10285.1 unnamed protein product [Albugo candida]